MKRALIVSWSVVAYAGFLAVVLWAIAFLADLHVVTAVDRGPGDRWLQAVMIDLALLGAFAVHHSVMARECAKRLITRVVPRAAERSTYVLVADALLALVLWQWRPIAGSVWHVSAQPWREVLWARYGLGWLTAVASTFMVDHFDLVGLRQAASRPSDYEPPTFKVRWLYARVRHPLMLGLLIAFWITPDMTAGHLLFAVAQRATSRSASSLRNATSGGSSDSAISTTPARFRRSFPGSIADGLTHRTAGEGRPRRHRRAVNPNPRPGLLFLSHG